MIQRIQSLFIFAAVITTILFLYFPLSHFALTDFNVDFFTSGFKQAGTDELLLATTPLYMLCIGILFLSIIALFLYKKRILQIRFCIYNMLLNVGLIGMLALNINDFIKNNAVEAHSFSPFLAIPIVNIILLYLAFRGIRKDEVLIKAYDRLR